MCTCVHTYVCVCQRNKTILPTEDTFIPVWKREKTQFITGLAIDRFIFM